MKQENLRTSNAVEHYEAPDMETFNLKLEQNILQNGSNDPGNTPGNIPLSDW